MFSQFSKGLSRNQFVLITGQKRTMSLKIISFVASLLVLNFKVRFSFYWDSRKEITYSMGVKTLGGKIEA